MRAIGRTLSTDHGGSAGLGVPDGSAASTWIRQCGLSTSGRAGSYSLTWVQEALPPGVLGDLRDRHGFKLFSQIWDYDEGNPLLVDYDRRIIETLEGYGVDMWSDVDELIAKIKWWLAHSGEREYAANTDHLRYIHQDNPATYAQTILREVGLL